MATPKGHIPGIENNSTNCFFNALLQAFGSCFPVLLHYLSPKEHYAGSFASRMYRILSELSFLHDYQRILDEPSELLADIGVECGISPAELLCRQNDSHELFSMVLECIESQRPKKTNKGGPSPGYRRCFPPVTEDCPFRGVVNCRLRCTVCGTSSHHRQEMIANVCLKMSMGEAFGRTRSSRTVPLQKLISEYFCEKDIPYSCKVCLLRSCLASAHSGRFARPCLMLGNLVIPKEPKSKMTKFTRFQKLPPVLVFHISRAFGFGRSRSPVVYPAELDMGPFATLSSLETPFPARPVSEAEGPSPVGTAKRVSLSESLAGLFAWSRPFASSAMKFRSSKRRYRLTAVVEHRGGQSSGHFTATRRILPNQVARRLLRAAADGEAGSLSPREQQLALEHGCWVDVSDSTGRTVSEADALSREAFMLVYTRCDLYQRPLCELQETMAHCE